MFGARVGFADAGVVGPGIEQPNAPNVPVPMDEALGWLDTPGFHGFYKWVFALLGVLNDFVKQVVTDRREARSGHPVVTVDQFLDFVDPFLPQEAVLDLFRITGQDLLVTARAEKSTAGGLDGWAWNEIKALPLPWFSGLAILLNMV